MVKKENEIDGNKLEIKCAKSCQNITDKIKRVSSIN